MTNTFPMKFYWSFSARFRQPCLSSESILSISCKVSSSSLYLGKVSSFIWKSQFLKARSPSLLTVGCSSNHFSTASLCCSSFITFVTSFVSFSMSKAQSMYTNISSGFQPPAQRNPHLSIKVFFSTVSKSPIRFNFLLLDFEITNFRAKSAGVFASFWSYLALQCSETVKQFAKNTVVI